MPRELWAKVAVEIVRDPKLLLRAPWERWLWLGLICLTKEFGKDGVLTCDARTLAVTLDLGVKPAAVQAALEAFEKASMVRLLPDNAVELIHFKKRQAAGKDNPEAVAERQRRWRARHKGNGGVTGTVTEPFTRDDPRDVTADRSVTRNAEEEEEEEEEEDLGSAAAADLGSAEGGGGEIPPGFKSLTAFLTATWPGFPNPEKAVALWAEAFPKLDLLAQAKAARAKELATGKAIKQPGSYLQSWFETAVANPVTRKVNGSGNGNGHMQEGTPEWDAAKRAADERAKREREKTRALLDARDRVARQGHE